ncbi:MAG: CDP-alcohol phosphatidyltransferase family protein [Aliihoeflea sp.]|uniref:CDP-alcohol phosphatidyltransferase family protein n=1 Tax=Aliihoeflea sp. TaxID=2608088 RepID=UPI00403402FA
MLDGWARARIDPALDRAGSILARSGVTADAVTLAAFAAGLAAFVAIALEAYLSGLFLLLLSRICDGLDGAVARHTRKSDFGGYLDIVLDFAFYGLVPLGFVLADPSANAVAGAVLILSFYVNGASFLAYAVMAEKRGLSTDARGEKSLFFTTGLAEATETIAFFVAFCLFPQWFVVLAFVFAALCFYTAVSRIVIAARTFRN